jgi:hypothetical protein
VPSVSVAPSRRQRVVAVVLAKKLACSHEELLTRSLRWTSLSEGDLVFEDTEASSGEPVALNLPASRVELLERVAAARGLPLETVARLGLEVGLRGFAELHLKTSDYAPPPIEVERARPVVKALRAKAAPEQGTVKLEIMVSDRAWSALERQAAREARRAVPSRREHRELAAMRRLIENAIGRGLSELPSSVESPASDRRARTVRLAERIASRLDEVAKARGSTRAGEAGRALERGITGSA